MGHNVEYLISLVDRMSAPAEKIVAHFKNVNTTVNQVKASVDRVGKAQGFNQLNNSANKLPRSISELNMKLKELNSQLDNTHSKKSFINLRKEIKATEQQLSGLTGKMGGAGGGLGSLLSKGLAYFGGIYAIQKAFSFMSGNLDAYDAEAKARAQLKAGLISTRFASGKNVEGLEGQAVSLERKTLFRHDETMGAQAVLLSFSKIRGKIYDDIIPAIQDMTTRLGGDLVTNAKVLGKGLNDPAQSMMQLRRVGIQFTESQTKHIKELVHTGHLYEAQLMILNLLHEKFGGSAEAAAKAGMGATQQLANKWHTLRETIGERMAPAMNKFAIGLGSIVDKYRDFIKIPMSQKLEDERVGVNTLVNELYQHNLSAERRNELYDKLKDIAPQVLAGIDKENISWDKLRKNVANYNVELRKAIALETQKETLKPYEEKVFGATRKVQEIGDKISALFAEAAILSKNGDKITAISQNNKFPDDQKIRLVQSIISPEEGANYGKLSSIYNQLSDIATKNYEIFNTSSKEASTNLKTATTARDSVLNVTNRTLDRMFPLRDHSPEKSGGGGGGNPPGGGAPDPTDEIGGISAGGSKATNITVNLKDLIGIMNLHAGSATEGGKKVEDIVTEQLLRVLNSANRMGSQ